MKRRLALGHQEFSEVIKNECIYVDKTEDIYRLIHSGKYYFLSRPRRFGKSLLMNTIKELFSANKELFRGVWIYDKWNWEEKYPVIKISFSNIDYSKLGLYEAIAVEIQNIAVKYGITLTQKSNATKFKELIHKLSENREVVILIDEYDKPIIDNMTDIPKAEENRKTLKNFYSIMKDADKYIKFLMITGVSKFSQVSIFSDLNNLTDITIDPRFSTITGFTKKELDDNFSEYIDEIKQQYASIHPDIMQVVKEWYNGYSWDGNSRVYNPVSIMNFLSKKMFHNYWFSTGTPTMLLKIIEEQGITAFDIENAHSSTRILDKYDFKDIDLYSLLFQTGYLTVKELNMFNGKIKLDYPNREVSEAFSENILAKQSNTNVSKVENILHHVIDSLSSHEMEQFIKHVNQLFKNIPYSIVEDKENYFHSLFYLLVKLIGFEIYAEVLTIDGRIDAVIKTDDYIYIIEFKINQSAQQAIKQIKDKQYADKYKTDGKKITLLGINFDTEKKCIDDFIKTYNE